MEILQGLLAAIAEADAERIRGSLRKLDEIVCQRKRELGPELLHFLQQRSYEKALAYLEGETEIPAGICGGIKRG